MKEPKLVRPSVAGIPNTDYLGHFAQDKFIQAGHNEVPKKKDYADSGAKKDADSSVWDKIGEKFAVSKDDPDALKKAQDISKAFGG